MTASREEPLEIERKYLIRMPDLSLLSGLPGCLVGEIEQIYLVSDRKTTHRIRCRTTAGTSVYTETTKIRVDHMSCIEQEREITATDYQRLAAQRDPTTHPITKTRYAFRIGEQLFEVDVYPFWSRVAVLETELDSRETAVVMPPFLTVLRELTGDSRFSNARLAHVLPTDPDLL